MLWLALVFMDFVVQENTENDQKSSRPRHESDRVSKDENR